MMGEQYFITNKWQLDRFIRTIKKEFEEKKYLIAILQSGRQRTILQNAALHLFFNNLAQELNEGGQEYKFQYFIKKEVDIPWSAQLVKELIWRPVQEAMFNISSTSDAKTVEYVKVYDVINRHLSNEYGINVAWPSQLK